ncbi:MAG: glutamine synthetase [Acidimicrobiia bacterium]|nr:glutamine synthetase family protein [Acidimicrobiia bacterium]MBT8248608.1 glutamine synthetase family protein [Acidimicrobiia bacterium]NNF89021.1 glutamine synthetase [Acidimicrobiia bacterium]NNL98389.1 glutamine synthetase [Acidimicrobiia bacterium]RZV43626.1 MAG: glutamine synthetase [Acidimicrobiia bacterium]
MRGLLSIDELRNLAEADEIDTVVVGFTDHYGRLHGKRFDAGFFLEDAHSAGTHACDYLLTVDMEMEPVAGYDYANWEKGYGDFHMVPDLATLRLADWLPRSAIVLCDLLDTSTHQPVAVAPRSILRRQLDRAADMGYSARAASELEYFIFEEGYRAAAEAGYANLRPVGWYIEDYHLLQGTREEPYNGSVRRHLSRSGIPVETSKGEWGRGQHEMNIRYAEVLEMADRHVLMKQCMKETADALGMSVTFMAKPHADEAGSSCHLHVSLWNDDGNAFPGEVAAGPLQVSDEFRWFLGGWMDKVAELIVLFAPTINSYKRFQSESWAPTRIAWSHDNRTAGFRIVGSGPGLRIECRIPGADVNPYLAYAAMLAAGLDGIENQIEPPAIFEGDVYAAEDLPEVPTTLGDALALFAGSEFAVRALGADVHEHYRHFFELELAAYDTAVTDWERQRYFERI